MGLKAKDLLTIEQLSAEDIELILHTAKEMKSIIKREIKKVPTLRGKTFITLFYEPSTRTRTSFELAGKYMSADVVNISTTTSSVTKGEKMCIRDRKKIARRKGKTNVMCISAEKYAPKKCVQHATDL